MKKLLLFLIFSLSLLPSSAQNSKSVIKSILDNKFEEAYEKFPKIDSIGETEKHPALYLLARAMLINTFQDKKLEAYEEFYNSYLQITDSEEVKKVLASQKSSLEKVKADFDTQSMEEVMKIDTEECYRAYIKKAEIIGHPHLDTLNKALEERIYNDAYDNFSIESFDYYLKLYPQSEHREEILVWVTDLYYAKAMTSNDEQEVESFVVNNPEFDPERMPLVKTRLANLRYARIIQERKFSDLKTFSETYPDYPEIDQILQAMADIEYELLSDENNLNAMRQFINRYPKAQQTPEVTRRLTAGYAIANNKISDVFSYVTTYGYDEYYPQFIGHFFKYHDILILTPDIREVVLVRFSNAAGKIGFMDLAGNVVVEPKWDNTLPPTMNNGEYQQIRALEVMKNRPIAAIKQGDKWGVIDSLGKVILSPQFLNIDFRNREIRGAIRKDGDRVLPGYYYNRFDLNGKLLASNLRMTLAEIPDKRLPEFDRSLEFRYEYEGDSDSQLLIGPSGEYIADALYFHYVTPQYARYEESESKRYVVSYNGVISSTEFLCVQGISDHIVVAHRTEDMRRKYYLIDLHKPAGKEILRECSQKDQFGTLQNNRIPYCQTEKNYGYLNEQLEEVIPASFYTAGDFNCGVAPVSDTNGNHWLITPDGKPLDNNQFDEIRSLKELGGIPGLFIVRKEKYYGVIDANGNEIIPINNLSTGEIQLKGGYIEWGNNTSSMLYVRP